MNGQASGLEEVVAADSAITWIDGNAGELRYRGYAIGDLAERCSFEDVAYLLWHGDLPDQAELAVLKARLRDRRMEKADLIRWLRDVPVTGHPLDVLRYLVSRDALDNPSAWVGGSEANLEKSIEMAAWFPTAVAAYHRLRAGLEPIQPRPDLDTAGVFLWMLHGREPQDVAVRTLDTSLILHADHELNASTFAARVTIATQSNMHAAVASALGTLAGPRHGGASELVIRMLEKIGDRSHAEAYVRDVLSRRERVMGFGHRVYHTTDPRSIYLRRMAAGMLAGTPHEPWIGILEELGRIMARERNRYPNVDLYAAVVNHELGIEPAFYTSVFAISRVTGWTAHAMEQLSGRLIRPVARYVGPEPRQVAKPVGV